MGPHCLVRPHFFPIIPKQLFLGEVVSLFGLIYSPPACDQLGFLGAVVVTCSHLVESMLHVSYLMVWLVTRVG